MPIDMDMYDSAYENGCDSVGDIGMPPPRRRSTDWDGEKRTHEETILLECQLINSCSDLTPEYWIKIYSKRFRECMDHDSSLPAARVKRILYANEPIGKPRSDSYKQ